MTEESQPAIDIFDVPTQDEGSYPEPFDEPCKPRVKRALGDYFGLEQFGVNLVELAPGGWSAQRHWHSHEDELVYVISGQLTLVTDSGEQVLTSGMATGFRHDVSNGHHLVNRSGATAVFLEIGTREPHDDCHYPDVDLFLASTPNGHVFQHKDGTPYD